MAKTKTEKKDNLAGLERTIDQNEFRTENFKYFWSSRIVWRGTEYNQMG